MSFKHIDRFLERGASKSEREHGLRIFKSKKVKILNENPTVDKFTFQVESEIGNVSHRVELHDVLSNDIKFTCSCPSPDIYLCTHSIASLHCIKQKLVIDAAATEQKEYPQSDIRVNISKGINDFILQKTNKEFYKIKGLNILGNHGVGKPIEGSNKVRFEVEENSRKYTVEFERLDKNILKTSCTCHERECELCSHKYSVFYLLAYVEGDKYYFDKFLNHEAEKIELLAEYGFTLKDDISKKFTFKTDRGKLSLLPLDPFLIKINDLTSIGNKILVADNNKEKYLSFEDDLNNETENSLAFVFNYDSDSFNDQYLIPIVVKLNKKQKLEKVIERVDDCSIKDLPVLSKEEDEILRLINEFSSNDRLNYLIEKKFGVITKVTPEIELFEVDYHFQLLKKIHNYLKDKMVFRITEDSYRISKRNLQPVHLSDKKLQMKFSLTEKEDLFELKTYFFLEGNEDALLLLNYVDDSQNNSDHNQENNIEETEEENTEEADDFDESYYWDDDDMFEEEENEQETVGKYYYQNQNVLHFHGDAQHSLKLRYFYDNPIIKIHNSQFERFLNQMVLPLTKSYKVEMKVKKKPKHEKASDPVAKVYIKELDKFLLIQPAIHYKEKEVELFDKELIVSTESNELTYFDREEVFESDLRDYFISLHPDFPRQTDRGVFYIRLENVFKDNWFINFFQQLKEKKFEILGVEKLTSLNKYNYHRPVVQIKSSSGIDWFDLDVQISYGGQKVKLKDVQKSFLKGEKYIKLSDGTLGVLPEEWLKKLETALKMGDIKGNKIQVSKLHFSLLDSLFNELDEKKLIKELSEKKRKLLDFTHIPSVDPPKPNGAELREYQIASFHWLNFLSEYSWSGCLADDMGLGKTLQMLTFLKHQCSVTPDKANLIVMPTTLLFNWTKETEKFFPELKTLVLYGGQRVKDINEFLNYNLIFISYHTLIRDIEFIKNYDFNYLILDESQAIKNPLSQRYKAVRLLKGKNKVALTGTPIENNTFDLYSQMSFLNPGLLGSIEFFKEEFSNPIDKKGDVRKAEELRKIIKPFLLRRTKEQVATELPDKTEMVLYCDMEEEQRKVYNAFRDHYRDIVLNKIDEDGLGKSSIVILDALMKLRQICNSPALLNTEENYGDESVKLKELLRNIIEKTGSHKVLVFSQFVKMLKLVEKELQNHNIEFEYLDGKSKNREEKVKRFQDDKSCRVFLISLKAGGVGINLTEADYVYLVDPWWNPAIESQAIDRTHRIGQSKKVFAYRMICRDTIEEKVLKLQERKKTVANELIQTEASFMKQLEKNDIEDLFR